MVNIIPNGDKYTLIINDVVIGENYTSLSKACKKAYKYLNSQGL